MELEKLKQIMIEKSNSEQQAKTNISLHPLAVEEFAKIIEEDEEIMFCSSGSIEGRNRNGMVYVTNERVVVCLKLFRTHIENFHYENITAVDFRTKMLGHGVIQIDSYGESKKINYYDAGKDGDYLRKTVKYIKDKMLESKRPKQQVIQNDDFISQLERLAKLKEQGILSEDEFNQQKLKLLSQ